MGLLDQVISNVLGNMGGQGGTGGQQPHPSALQGMLGALFAGVPGGQNTTGVGGLQGLLNRFQAQGLGHVATSWTDPNQPNLPVSPQDLQRVLGNERVQNIAAQTGMSPELVLGQLAQFLPHFVSQLAPGGRVPPPHEDPTLAEFGQGTAGGGTTGGGPGVANPFNT